MPTPPAFQPALQPFWGDNRPFAIPSDAFAAPGPPPPYSEAVGSAFHTEANECYLTGVNLTPEQEAIARFWSDDPGQTFTPPGHSISILTQVARMLRLDLARAAEAYAKLGVAVADAFVACWHTKFQYNLLRPITCIRSVIDPTWTPLLTTPPFPEYTSGHSAHSGAAAQVLTDLFGPCRSSTTRTRAAGCPPEPSPRSGPQPEEAAVSRLYGRIHFRAAIERGLEQGRSVGLRASALSTRFSRH